MKPNIRFVEKPWGGRPIIPLPRGTFECEHAIYLICREVDISPEFARFIFLRGGFIETEGWRYEAEHPDKEDHENVRQDSD